ncbi:hypothetical protein PhCBS80983_g01021 [Powellomyces hirtus]|uniref:Uncharacterized protein n=1 Tax=Powellomyces hirtus TaxID=109895 RepID=A0A507ECD9_9FUNG|nr:hypothetical protein PhCBS80983_g01021 [Powellomyces hirtus]
MITIGGLSGVVGDPDIFWVTGEFMKPKFVMEYKTPWVLSVTGSIIPEYKNNSAEVVKAIQQLYGYLTFNDLRHGALSTYNVTCFFRQTYPSNGKEPPKLFGAYIKILRLADVDGSHQHPRRVPAAALVATL